MEATEATNLNHALPDPFLGAKEILFLNSEDCGGKQEKKETEKKKYWEEKLNEKKIMKPETIWLLKCLWGP
jgi:hypothetical protein